ncbi:hypothetical protein GCM10027515_26680 [Schumannella luteola]|uniref:Uncharacterized protein n=1 Tax=Schumannella luteola TaxID=472059 RepID=A0A852YQN1_9MICO|nr:hypothetical protein [Schumannella luteola]NYG99535.1 hypothetical protein [Schumannella luteola]TPX03853.1 hypothetical protein FJ656_15085 [Schumannella luteola]
MSDHHQSPAWSKTVRTIRPRLEAQRRAGSLVCIDCHKPIQPGENFSVGHKVSAAQAKRMGWTEAQINAPSNLGGTHSFRGGKGAGTRRCNEKGGGQIGASLRIKKASAAKRRPEWSQW